MISLLPRGIPVSERPRVTAGDCREFPAVSIPDAIVAAIRSGNMAALPALLDAARAINEYQATAGRRTS